MGMNGGSYLLGGESQLYGQGTFHDQVAGVGAEDMQADNGVLLISQHLYHSVGFAHGHRFAVGSELELAGTIGYALGFGCLFTQTHTGDLG